MRPVALRQVFTTAISYFIVVCIPPALLRTMLRRRLRLARLRCKTPFYANKFKSASANIYLKLSVFCTVFDSSLFALPLWGWREDHLQWCFWWLSGLVVTENIKVSLVRLSMVAAVVCFADKLFGVDQHIPPFFLHDNEDIINRQYTNIMNKVFSSQFCAHTLNIW